MRGVSTVRARDGEVRHAFYGQRDGIYKDLKDLEA